MKESEVPKLEFNFSIRKPYGNNLRFKATFTGDARDKEWVSKAKCSEQTGDYFYVDDKEKQQETAYYLCRSFGRECPVQLPCLIDSIEKGEHWGVRGGLTELERRKFMRQYGEKILDLMKDEDARFKALTIDRNTHPEKYAHLDVAEPVRRSLLPLVEIEGPSQQSA